MGKKGIHGCNSQTHGSSTKKKKKKKEKENGNGKKNLKKEEGTPFAHTRMHVISKSHDGVVQYTPALN